MPQFSLPHVDYLSGLGWVIGFGIALVGVITIARVWSEDEKEQKTSGAENLPFWTGSSWMILPEVAPDPTSEEVSIALRMIERSGAKQ